MANMMITRKLNDAAGALQYAMSMALNSSPGDMAVLKARVDSMLGNPIIDMADMYKTSHKSMYPDNMDYLQSYGEARVGSKLTNIVPFGIQAIVNELCGVRITQTHIEEAAIFFKSTFQTDDVFARVAPGWQTIVDEGGHLPIKISALPEGTVVPPGTPLFTVESTNSEVPWLANWVETKLSHIWYTTTVASVAFQMRQDLETRCLAEGMTAAEASSHAKVAGVCDFGLRGVESIDAGRRGGMAVLTSVCSSDNTAGMNAVADHYPDSNRYMQFGSIGTSIPAAEHSTITCFGKDKETDAYAQILARFPTGPVSIVADSYDYHNAVSAIFCGTLKETIDNRYAKAIQTQPEGIHAVVIRPDSGDMLKNVPWTLDELYKAFGGTTNAKGFKVLHPSVRVIQGDGIDLDSYPKLLDAVQAAGFSVTNIVAGSGGGLLQKVNRDTIRFAIKANTAIVDGTQRDVRKETTGKTSKRGRLTVEPKEDGTFEVHEDGKGAAKKNAIRAVFSDGNSLVTDTFSEIRARIDEAHERCHKKRRVTEAAAETGSTTEETVPAPDADLASALVKTPAPAAAAQTEPTSADA